jgi:hypothetical protein
MAIKELGRDVSKSLEIMDKLSDDLKEFSNMPLKKGLQSNKIADEKLVKVINDASEKAISLRNAIEDIKHQISGAKPPNNSRFASRVVAKFLENA